MAKKYNSTAMAAAMGPAKPKPKAGSRIPGSSARYTENDEPGIGNGDFTYKTDLKLPAANRNFGNAVTKGSGNASGKRRPG